MLCDKCLNKSICKYYDLFRDAPMIINIESCEKAKFDTDVQPIRSSTSTLSIKKPIDYSQFNVDEVIEEIDETEEKVLVDLSENKPAKVTSITDLLLGVDDNE